MSIKLNKICREYNVGLHTVVEFFKKNGIEIEPSPNAKISDEQYALIRESLDNRPLRILPWAAEPFTNDPRENREIINSHGWNKLRNDVILLWENKYILFPKTFIGSGLKFWTVDVIQSKCPSAIIQDRVIYVNKLCEHSGLLPVAPDISEETVHHDESVFRFGAPKVNKTIAVQGKIDLSALNSATRPQRKTKEEKRIEREKRQKQHTSQNSKIANDVKGSSNNNDNLSKDAIRDIWQRFVDIQEKLIRQRCSPISIKTDSIEIENDKLHVTVDETSNEQQVEKILKEQLGADDYNLESGSILVDELKWNNLTENELTSIRKTLSANYIELDTTPSINATIDYANSMGRSDQMSIEELRQLESIIEQGHLIEGTIDDTAAFISKVTVLREEYMHYLFGDHYVTYEKARKKNSKPQIIDAFEYHNQYIPLEEYNKYQNLGLLCKHYNIIFKVNNESAKEELKDCYDCWFPNTETFEFKRAFTRKDPFHPNFLDEINANIKAFMDEASMFCSASDIDIDVLFSYTISKHNLIKSKLKEVATVLSGREGYSFNEDTGAIGIDFDWRNQDITELIRKVEESVPFIKVNVFDEHRYKCKVNTQIVGFEEIKQVLEDKYEDITIENDNVYHKINIRLPYVESDLYDPLCARLQNDLLQVSITGINVEFVPKVEGKIRLNVNYNAESRLEDLEESIVDMRRADFGFVLGEKEFPFGKLLKANYPELTFDIDVAEEKKDQVIEAFESGAISTIVPILTGDLEKISRLKNTFTMATTGADLANSRLQRFIFDSSEATKTADIELMLRHDSVVYKELCEHLLNTRVNESQKQAIIKAMYADDLAVIQGPPGTGKSTAIAELIWQLVRKGLQQGNKRERILLTSETNLAVDNAISRIVNNKTNLVKPVRFGGEEKLESEGLQFSIDLMKRWVEEGDACLVTDETDEETETKITTDLILKNWVNNISERAFYRSDSEDNEVIKRWRNYLSNPNKKLRDIVYKRYVENANVIGATCSSIGDKKAGNDEFNGFTPFYHNFCDVFKQKKGRARIEFTTVIQDESSKATPAELVLPFVYGNRAIVIGDHRQLPPMLDKEEFEETLDYALKLAVDDKDKKTIEQLQQFVDEHFDEMEISHFQRLYEGIDNSLKGTFNLQYRMHPDINEVIEQFYREDGGLRCGLTYPKDLGVNDKNIKNPASRYHGIDINGLIGHDTHVLFIDSKSPEMLDGTSRVNYGEVETIDKLLERFENSNTFQKYLERFTKEDDKQIGIISFYGKQIKQLRSVAHNHPNLPIRVSTVDRFQGMERNIVIVSMVRSNIIQSSKNQPPNWKRYPDLGYPKQKSLGFAQSPNRLNVALSRAKRLLIIVGNRELFSELDIYQRLFATIESNKNNNVVTQEEV